MCASLVQANGFRAWEKNPEVCNINKRAPHADIIPYTSFEGASKYCKCSQVKQSLNGEWKFLYFPNPAACDAAFPKGLEGSHEIEKWNTIKVPSNWQFQGYDKQQYVNVKYPWEQTDQVMWPDIPHNDNPVGIYGLNFCYTPSKDKLQFLRFEGVESYCEVYLNGKFVGLHKGSFTPGEYSVTGVLTQGSNQLIVRVIKWCDHSWLEDQDMFRLSGIFRDVNIYEVPKVHIEDYWVKSGLDDKYKDGTLKVEVTLSTKDKQKVKFTLLSGGAKVLEKEFEANGGKATFDAKIDNVNVWSDEKPNLYNVVLQVGDHIVATRTGFRRFEIRDGVMYINNVRIIFKGCNRHEFGATFGRAITKEVMEQDVLTYKRNNINSTRTSHYPNNTYWYDLCDEYGLYVIDEVNLETHGAIDMDIPYKENRFEPLPGDRPECEKACMDRTRDMFYRDRNHPSIIIWSLGNESYCGANHGKMYKFLKEQDDSRIVQYEGIAHTPHQEYRAFTDVTSEMYTPAALFEKKFGGEKKPAFLIEYAHAMGNSLGSLRKYMNLFEKVPNIQGGFIWDFVDQAIMKKDESGKEYLGYGGDFGDVYNDGNFSGDGLLFADRKETPKIWETKVVYQPVDFFINNWSDGTVKVKNKFFFTNLNEYDFFFCLMNNEKKVKCGQFEVSCEATKEAVVKLPIDIKGLEGEVILTCYCKVKCCKSWAPKGHVVAFGQMITGEKKPQSCLTCTKNCSPLKVVQNWGCICVQGKDFEYKFSYRHGDLFSIIKNGKEYLKQPMRPNFWRASVDNDRGSRQTWRSQEWRTAHNCFRSIKLVKQSEHSVVIRMENSLETHVPSKFISEVNIASNGVITFENKFVGAKTLPDIPEIGYMFVLPVEFDKMNWFGLGQHDSYIDRRESNIVGVFSDTVANRYVNYLKPQECGNIVDVRRLTLHANDGRRLSVFGLPLVEANVLHYTPEELENAMHPVDLDIPSKTVLRINYKQAGVGGDNTWDLDAMPHPEFRISGEKEYTYSFAIKPE